MSTDEPVGYLGENRYILPVSQILTPVGKQVELPGLRPQVLALSPDGEILLTSGKTSEVVVIDPVSGEIIQRVILPSEDRRLPKAVSDHVLEPDVEGQVSYTGLVFSPDGRRVCLSNANGSIKVFEVAISGWLHPSHTIALPETRLPRRQEAIPSGLRFSEDGKRLYTVLNLSNRLAEIDMETAEILRLFDVGVAPFDVMLVGRKAYVSNWGGRRPGAADLIGPAGRGSVVRVDPVRHIASEGSVSVIDLESGELIREILVGLHSSAMARTPDGRYLAVANAASDSVSVIDTTTDIVTETISLRWQPGMLRTIELILGLPPMTQMDAVATPLVDCFTDRPDFTPYEAVPNQILLDEMNPPKAVIRDPFMRELAMLSETLPLDQVDQCPEDLLNRIIWHAQKGPKAPYPEWAIRRGVHGN